MTKEYLTYDEVIQTMTDTFEDEARSGNDENADGLGWLWEQYGYGKLADTTDNEAKAALGDKYEPRATYFVVDCTDA